MILCHIPSLMGLIRNTVGIAALALSACSPQSPQGRERQVTLHKTPYESSHSLCQQI